MRLLAGLFVLVVVGCSGTPRVDEEGDAGPGGCEISATGACEGPQGLLCCRETAQQLDLDDGCLRAYSGHGTVGCVTPANGTSCGSNQETGCWMKRDADGGVIGVLTTPSTTFRSPASLDFVPCDDAARDMSRAPQCVP